MRNIKPGLSYEEVCDLDVYVVGFKEPGNIIGMTDNSYIVGWAGKFPTPEKGYKKPNYPTMLVHSCNIMVL